MRLVLIVMLAACLGPVVAASDGSAAAPAQTTKVKATPPATAAATTPRSPATTAPATKAPATAARQETLEEIVARVQRRLAMETPRKPHATAPRPPASERVKLVWRPAVVWPPELAPGAPPSASVVEPTPAPARP